MPAPGTLARMLEKLVDKTLPITDAQASRDVLTCFATAAVEMWLKSLHSFLISASLTEASPIWASVSGYYASHYAIRGFAHLFGVFQLHKARRIVHLKRENNRYFLRIEQRAGNSREHKFYWKYVSEQPLFNDDPFFYPNQDDLPRSDGAHRNMANYWDHVDHFPIFRPLEQKVLSSRIERISTIEFNDVPRPNADKFPDINNIQIVAYHRIVKFRQCLDDILKSGNRFWRVHRTPSWCQNMMTFHVVDLSHAGLSMRES